MRRPEFYARGGKIVRPVYKSVAIRREPRPELGKTLHRIPAPWPWYLRFAGPGTRSLSRHRYRAGLLLAARWWLFYQLADAIAATDASSRSIKPLEVGRGHNTEGGEVALGISRLGTEALLVICCIDRHRRSDSAASGVRRR